MSNPEKQVNGGFRLLRKAVNQQAFLKAGILGFQGSGKTFTAANIASGLAKHIKSDKPIAFFDTETGSDFLIERFKKEGFELFVAKTRAFTDLLQFMKEAEAGASVAIIDSISHVWRDLMDSYVKKLGRKNGLYFQDWAALKKEWGQFTDIYINSKVHTIVCGRAGYEYDFEKDETGKNELVKTGTKMKAEGEFGYEASLLLEMVRLKKSEIEGNIKLKGWINRCYILKDRTDQLNGAEIDYPTFKAFEPIIKKLNIGGEHLGVDTSRNSEELFDGVDRSYTQRMKQVEVTLELIDAELTKAGMDGNSGDAKRCRIRLLEDVFGTASKAAVEGMRLEDLQAALERLKNMDLVAYLEAFKAEQVKKEEPKEKPIKKAVGA